MARSKNSLDGNGDSKESLTIGHWRFEFSSTPQNQRRAACVSRCAHECGRWGCVVEWIEE